MQAKNLNLDSYISFNIFKQIFRNFCQGGWGLGPTARKQPGQCFFYFFFFFFFLSQLILQFTEGVQQWFYCRENYTFPRIQRGCNIFQGVGSNFPGGGGGLNAYFYRNPYNVIFQGGGGGGGGSGLPFPPSRSAHVYSTVAMHE